MRIPRLIKFVSADGLVRIEPFGFDERRSCISRVLEQKLKVNFYTAEMPVDDCVTKKRDYEFLEEQWDYERGVMITTYKEKQ